MAASFAALANTLRITSAARLQVLTAGPRLYATSCKPPDGRNIRIAMAPDRSSIICWHPEPEFPYEYTQPMPRLEEESAEGESLLKVNLLLEEKLKMRHDGPTDNELSNMFFTTKHTWKPNTQKKYKGPEQPPDREGL